MIVKRRTPLNRILTLLSGNTPNTDNFDMHQLVREGRMVRGNNTAEKNKYLLIKLRPMQSCQEYYTVSHQIIANSIGENIIICKFSPVGCGSGLSGTCGAPIFIELRGSVEPGLSIILKAAA